ncbi:hypothetical protein NP493_4693g00008 [Ridgeia piscesae]|uniref:Cadherin domain-containing protein n=1 Tax=Ridgeia piscesae TaxID=27915 RepID=A0AAD9IZ35_RIDPI|nr:hypothetical protein NP493_4693g00008 [Ridgeia piscesae]
MATDGAFVTSAEVRVSVLDANDNSPVCYMPMYEKVVAENVPVGTVIVRVTASDEDEPGSVNSAIEYSLDSTADGTFKIHKTLVQLLYSVHLSAGIVSTADVLDRESVDKYTLTVRATDGGGRSCTSRVYITLSESTTSPGLHNEQLSTDDS